MKYALGNMLNGAGSLNPDGLSLDLRFAADKTLTARKGPTPVFTRASAATFVGSDGLIQSAAVNAARFDHDPLTLACKGLLIEESRTNLCLQSNAFSTSPWANINTVCNVSQNETGVDGIANSAWTFTDDSNVNAEGRFLTASLTSGVGYSVSIFVKKTTGTPSTYPAIWLARGGNFGGCVINTTAGTATVITVFGAGTIISTTASVVDFGNFWRVTSFITPNATGSWEISISPSGNGTGTGVMDGTTTGSAVFWGAQLEVGAFPTSYISTTTGSVVRSADVCSITGSAFTEFFGSSPAEFTWNTSFSHLPTRVAQLNLRTIADFSNGGNRRWVYGDANTNDTFQGKYFEVTNNVTMGIASSYPYKIAMALTPTNNFFSVNGATAGSGVTSGALLSSVTGLHIGQTGSYHFQYLKGYKKRLSNAKLQTLST